MQYRAGMIGCSWNNKSFISLGIQFFMRIWSKKYYHKKMKQAVSHALIVLQKQLEMGLFVTEAIEDGVHTISLTETNYFSGTSVFWLEPVVPWTKEELIRMEIKARYYTDKITRYEFSNLFFQAEMILDPNHTYEGKITDFRVFCSKLVALIINASGREFYKEPWKVNPVDILYHPDLKIVTE